MNDACGSAMTRCWQQYLDSPREIKTGETKMKKFHTAALILILILVVSSPYVFAQSRIRFSRGSTSASVSGTLYGGDTRTYVLNARYGQYLSANVSSRNGCVTFQNGETSASYTTISGNNHLYVGNGCGRTTSFTLTVSISRQ